MKKYLYITSAVNVENDVPFSYYISPKERLADLVKGLRFFLIDKKFDRIFIVDSTGYDIKMIEDLDYRIKTFSFTKSKEEVAKRGKGYGEFKSTEHLINQLDLNDEDVIVKVNGRYIIHNYRSYSCVDDVCFSLRKGLSFADTRIYTAPVRFIKHYLLAECAEIDDNAGLIYELKVARAVLRWMADGGKFILGPLPDYEARSGTDGRVKKKNIFRSFLIKFYHYFAVKVFTF